MTEADRLREAIMKCEERREKRKTQRTILVLVVLSIIIYYVGTGAEVFGFLEGLIIAPILAIIWLIVSIFTLVPIRTAGSVEEYELGHLRKALYQIEAEQEKGQK